MAAYVFSLSPTLFFCLSKHCCSELQGSHAGSGQEQADCCTNTLRTNLKMGAGEMAQCLSHFPIAMTNQDQDNLRESEAMTVEKRRSGSGSGSSSSLAH